jgi:membrane associated rhomboid family serine protease
MPKGSKICPECGALNGRDTARCARCASPFPGALTALVQRFGEAALGRDVPMTKLFVGGCCVVFALLIIDAGELSILGAPTYWGPLRWGALTPGLGPVEPWRFVAATFVHFGALHIVFNMLALVYLGRSLEPQLGSARYIVLLVVTSTAGFVLSWVWDIGSGALNGVTGGASGGVFGLVGALIGYLYARRDPAWKQIAIRFGLYAVLMAVMMGAGSGGIRINNAAHLGGFLAGAPLGYFFYKESRPWRRHTLFRVLAACCVALCLASVVLSHHSDVWRAQRAIELLRRT